MKQETVRIIEKDGIKLDEDVAGPGFLQDYQTLFPPRRTNWHFQSSYVPGQSNSWMTGRGYLSDYNLARHLDPVDRYWVGCRSPLDNNTPKTPFLLLDFDRNDGQDIAWGRIQRIAEHFAVRPIVFTSPGGGYHAIWFFSEMVPLSAFLDLKHPQSRGLIFRILQDGLGEKPRPGVCEVFPQPNGIVRWPMGTDQHLVDWATGSPVQGLRLPQTLHEVKRYREGSEFISVKKFRDLEPIENKPITEAGVGFPRRSGISKGVGVSVSPEGLLDNTPISPKTQEEGIKLFRTGLEEPGTRNASTFKVALVMTHSPESLVPFGFNPKGDLPDQLLEWLCRGHNGLSKEFPGPDQVVLQDWREKAERTLADAEMATLNPH